MERDDSDGRYLVYSSTEEPDYEADWLLDIRLYSRSFRADGAFNPFFVLNPEPVNGYFKIFFSFTLPIFC